MGRVVASQVGKVVNVATIAVLKLCTDALVKLEVELDNFISDDGIDEVNN